jgi:hypothetical protein
MIIIHPSRGRPEQALSTMAKWVEASKVATQKENYYLIIDNDDPDKENYQRIFTGVATIISADNHNVVEAVNQAVDILTNKTDIVVLVSDDFDPLPEWDAKIEALITDPSQPIILHTFDGHQRGIITLPIFTCEVVKQTGYIYHPAFRHHFCDDYMTWEAKKNGWYKEAFDLTFNHNHVAWSAAPMDQTYKEGGMNQAHYLWGQQQFKKLTENV